MEKIQQWHPNAKSARKFVNGSINSQFGMLSRDYNGMRVASVKIVSKDTVEKRRLYDIYLTPRKRRKR